MVYSHIPVLNVLMNMPLCHLLDIFGHYIFADILQLRCTALQLIWYMHVAIYVPMNIMFTMRYLKRNYAMHSDFGFAGDVKIRPSRCNKCFVICTLNSICHWCTIHITLQLYLDFIQTVCRKCHYSSSKFLTSNLFQYEYIYALAESISSTLSAQHN